MNPATVDFHFDPMCPFAYQTSIWIRRVCEQLAIAVNWRFFSLEWVNHVEGKKYPWEREWSYGWSLMRIGALLRRHDMADLDRWYGAIGAELHEHGGSPHRQDVARRILNDLGFGAATLDAALADPTTHEEVKDDHTRVIDVGGFGVPTMFISGEQPVFGPVLVDPPSGADAVALWQVVTGMSALPQVFELQRPKSPADTARIAERLRPYVRGRDWVSIDRGRVIDLDALVNGDLDERA